MGGLDWLDIVSVLSVLAVPPQHAVVGNDEHCSFK
jgi:hypothetical protein